MKKHVLTSNSLAPNKYVSVGHRFKPVFKDSGCRFFPRMYSREADHISVYKDFGGIRIEDDILVTQDGCRFIGKDRIPYHPNDIEEFMLSSQQ